MSVYVAIALFSIIILIYLAISGLFTILFRFTGLPEERARFQVISLLTGTGFTTRESEIVLTSRSRRRLARVTMLFGYVFNITVLTAFVNVFLSLKASDITQFLLSIPIPLVAVALIVIFTRVPAVKAWGWRKMEKLAGRILFPDAKNTALLLDHIGKDTIVQVRLMEVPEFLQGVPLLDSRLKEDHDIMVMLVERSDGDPELASGRTVVEKGDKLTVFGEYRTVCEVFQAKERFDAESPV